MNNLFRGIPFSHEDKIHVHIQESSLLGRRTKGNLAWFFHSVLQVFEMVFCRKSPISTGRNGRLKPGKLLIGHKIKQFSKSLLWYSESRIFLNTGRFFIDSPGRVQNWSFSSVMDSITNPK